MILSAVLIFHFLVVFQIIPYQNVWAGKLTTLNEMYVFESISIFINLLLMTTMALKANWIRHALPIHVINGIIWFFVVVFALNTVGNLFSKSIYELIGGTTFTAISSFLCWRIVK
jgi:hypothetical protein